MPCEVSLCAAIESKADISRRSLGLEMPQSVGSLSHLNNIDHVTSNPSQRQLIVCGWKATIINAGIKEISREDGLVSQKGAAALHSNPSRYHCFEGLDHFVGGWDNRRSLTGKITCCCSNARTQNCQKTQFVFTEKTFPSIGWI